MPDRRGRRTGFESTGDPGGIVPGPEEEKMLDGCDHCGTVMKRETRSGAADCPECGRTLRQVDDFEARVLGRERRIAEQFRRANRLQAVRDARRGLELL
jgi:predicted RNA-binding Zn-ribbon protein involved in translation (DUF1610 family)